MFAQRLSLHGLVLSKDRGERSSTDLTQVQSFLPSPFSSSHNFPSIHSHSEVFLLLCSTSVADAALSDRPPLWIAAVFLFFWLKHDVRHRCEMSHLKLDAAEHDCGGRDTVCVCLRVCHSSLTQDNRLGPCPSPSQPLQSLQNSICLFLLRMLHELLALLPPSLLSLAS